MYLFAHRGVHDEYYENSAQAIITAINRGFSIEIDLRDTRDFEFVIIHDSNTNRVLGNDMEVHKSKFKDIRNLNSKSRILTLKELLNIFLDHSKKEITQQIAIHYKCAHSQSHIKFINDLQKFNELNKSIDIFNKIFVFDITKKLANTFKINEPNLKIAYSIGEDKLFPNYMYPTIYSKKNIYDNDNYDFIWGDEWYGGLYSKEFIGFFHKLGKKVFAISPELRKFTSPSHKYSNDIFEIKKLWLNLIKWGIDGICTDFIEELKGVVKNE